MPRMRWSTHTCLSTFSHCQAACFHSVDHTHSNLTSLPAIHAHFMPGLYNVVALLCKVNSLLSFVTHTWVDRGGLISFTKSKLSPSTACVVIDVYVIDRLCDVLYVSSRQ